MSRGKWVCVRSTSAARRHLQRPAPNGRGLQNTPLGSTHGRTTSGVACHHRLWAAHTVGRSRAWHAIIALEQHTQSNDVGRGMPSSPLVSINGQTTSGVVCPHRLWVAHTVERRRAWRAIIAFGQHIRSIDVGCGMPSSPLDSTDGQPTSGVACHHRLWDANTVERRRAWHPIIAFGQHTRSTDVGRGMPSSPLDSIHGRATSGVACHHRLWAADTVERRRAWHAIIAFGLHTRSNDVGVGMSSSPLGSTHGRTTSGVACHHHPWQHTRSSDVGRGMPSSPLGSTHGRATSGVACPHRLWAAHTVERRRALHAIIAFGQHTRSSDVGRGMPSSPLGSTHGRTTSGVAAVIAFGQHKRSNDVGCGMPSSPLDTTHGRTTSGVACHHHLWETHTIERCLAGHAIIAHGRQTQSNNVRRDIPSPPLDNTHGRTTSGVACHLAFGKHTRSKDVGRGMTSPP